MLQGDNFPKINTPDAVTATKTSHPHSGEKRNKDSVTGMHGNFIRALRIPTDPEEAESSRLPATH